MESYSDITTSFCFVMLPFLFLIIPFLIVFFVRKIRLAFIKSVLLYFICIFLQYSWWFLLATYDVPLFLIITNPFLIIAIILYIEGFNITSPLKTSCMLASLCGFFHGVGIYLEFVIGGFYDDDFIFTIPWIVIVGLLGAVPYCAVNFIFHFPYRIFRKARIRKKLSEFL